MPAKRVAVCNKNICVACGVCTKKCPKNAISIHKGCYAVVDEKCVGCGLCTRACPCGCLTVTQMEVEA